MPAPFDTNSGLLQWALDIYRNDESLGPGMEKIINDLGHKDASRITSDQFDAFYEAVEALKG